ncbi:unnamed protein product [Acidithrix sp. C25]|nr:unnamed protein product [Acidithrix sp. C25]
MANRQTTQRSAPLVILGNTSYQEAGKFPGNFKIKGVKTDKERQRTRDFRK